MKKFSLICALFLTMFIPISYGQYASRIFTRPTLPATCNPANGQVVFLTAGAGISPALYTCTATNTWRTAGMVGNGLVLNQGTLTASNPVLSTTATWNNAAVTFQNILSNVTNTASNAASTLIDLQMNSVSLFKLGVDGIVTLSNVGQFRAGAGGFFSWTGRSNISSSGDGSMLFQTSGLGVMSNIIFGPGTDDSTELRFNPPIGGVSQGLIIQQGDATPAVFADLGAAVNGSMIYCSDCTWANPCAGAGTGAYAKRINGAWRCD